MTGLSGFLGGGGYKNIRVSVTCTRPQNDKLFDSGTSNLFPFFIFYFCRTLTPRFPWSCTNEDHIRDACYPSSSLVAARRRSGPI